MAFRKKQNFKNVDKSPVDRLTFFLTISLTILGILAVADASAPQALSIFSDAYFFAKQQIIWATLGIIALIVFSQIDYQIYKKLYLYIFFASIILLVAVLVPGVGSKVLGARRWISIGPATLQPSEVAKLSLIIVLSSMIDNNKKWFHIAGILGLFSGLIMMQPDLGTTIVLVGIGLSQMFVAEINLLYMIALSSASALMGGLLIMISDYRRQRLITYIESSLDPLGNSYHMRQILIALGSGGLLGAGIGQSRQKHLFLPETATDSVFAVLAEELGFLGSLTIILFLAYFVLRLFKISINAKDKFGVVLGTGIATWIGAQMFLNISSMVAITPLTGIPLPFFSYGGSSLVMILAGVGIVLNISKSANLEKKDIIKRNEK